MIQVKGRLSSERVKCLLDQWYEKKAAEKFTEFFEQNWALLKFSLDKPKLQIKRLKKRWGSTSRKGLLTLNVDLICAPKECIEYVIVHELCHLQCKNHNTQFYKLLGKIMPDWERRKLKLETAMS